jgi:hypothetical protein
MFRLPLLANQTDGNQTDGKSGRKNKQFAYCQSRTKHPPAGEAVETSSICALVAYELDSSGKISSGKIYS